MIDNTMWTEKHRPAKLKELAGNEEMKSRVEAMLATGDISQHILLVGPPGNGKTTTARCIATTYLGDDFEDDFLEINASDERKIETIRTKVKSFLSVKTSNHYRIILLDEADSMVKLAQTSLRRIMELASKNARFILTANYINGIIEPIQSRCAIYRLRRLNDSEVTTTLTSIALQEGLTVDEDCWKYVCDYAEGDMRAAILFLQQASQKDKHVTMNVLNEIYDTTVEAQVAALMKEKDIAKIIEGVRALLYVRGVDGRDALLKMLRLIERDSIDREKRQLIVDKMAQVDVNLLQGANPELQLLHLFLSLTNND